MTLRVSRNPQNLEDVRRNFRLLGHPILGETPTGTIDGANVDFLLKSPALPDSLAVWKGASTTTLNRVSPAAYTTSLNATGKTKITFLVAPAGGSVLLVDYRV